ncbi:MAG: ACT domain-containing protein [Clostridia bacterium]|nr:ACT domain-containing protein [Clostridia bacterium]
MKTVISVIGKDAVGIIAKVSNVCAQNGVNIIDISQSVLQDMFVMVMLTDISNATCSFKDFSEHLQALGKEIGVDIHVMHEDIFNSMHRI